jgi:triosephosphate isomerase
MNGTKAEAAELLRGIIAGVSGMSKVDVAVCPPFPYLQVAEDMLKGTAIGWGSQDVSAEEGGAFTGQVSAAMLNDFGCRYAIVGHSERRQFNGETDAIIARKYAQAQAAGLVPILCVGETLEERESGKTEEVVARHIDAVLSTAGPEALALGVVAYEPVWAIGTGRTATPDQAQEAHAFVRNCLARALGGDAAEAIRILYGGSLKPGNAHDLLGRPDVDGGLIGGASLDVDSFSAIIRAAADCAAGE